MQVAYKAWIQNKTEYLHAQHAEGRKYTVRMVKKSKEQPRKSFGHKLDSTYWEVNKMFLPTILRLRGQNQILPDQSRNKTAS